MSNKLATSMAISNKVPALRFPEFKDDGEWEEKRLGDISVINQGLQISISKRFTKKVANSYFYITNEFLKKNSNISYYIQNPTASVLCDENDILMTRTGNTGQVVTNVRGAFHNNFFKIKYSNKIEKCFFVYFLKSENTQRKILSLAGLSTIPDLNHGDFYRIKILIPSLPEQQKIADCLSSLDQLVTAQRKKIDALKSHKKALMQKLFPAEGKTTPQLRFPAFKNAGKWEEKKLGKLGIFLSSLVGKKGSDFGNGTATFITYMNVFSNTFVNTQILRLVDVKENEKQNLVEKGDVLFTISSETPEEVGMSSVLLENLDNCYLNSFCQLFRFFEIQTLNIVFIGFLLRQPVIRQYFARKAQGSTRFNLSKQTFNDLPISLPSLPEQQKIADCLSSLDAHITAQQQKRDALLTHKKALMQQLFPSEEQTKHGT